MNSPTSSPPSTMLSAKPGKPSLSAAARSEPNKHNDHQPSDSEPDEKREPTEVRHSTRSHRIAAKLRRAGRRPLRRSRYWMAVQNVTIWRGWPGVCKLRSGSDLHCTAMMHPQRLA